MEPSSPQTARLVGGIMILVLILLAALLLWLPGGQPNRRQRAIRQVTMAFCHLPQHPQALQEIRRELRQAIGASLLPHYGHFLMVVAEHANHPWNCRQPPTGNSLTDQVRQIGFFLRCGDHAALPALIPRLRALPRGQKPAAYLRQLHQQLQRICPIVRRLPLTPTSSRTSRHGATP